MIPSSPLSVSDMLYATPKHSAREVNEAGDALINPATFFSDYEDALDIINNWRSSHNLPLLHFRLGLADKAQRIEPSALIAQRIKRLPAIRLKLERLPRLKLSQLQDIGGCRAVVQNPQRVHQLVKFYEESRSKHDLDHKSDYLAYPKSSGYRGIHLIYRYYSEKYKSHCGLKIEIQLRSKLQHAWATAVETVGIFTGEALKSSIGSEDWKRFFALMGSEIAMREKGVLVPHTPKNKTDLVKEIRAYIQRLDAIPKLNAYSSMLKMPTHPGLKGARYFLLELDPHAKNIKVTGFKKREFAQASERYLAVERSIGPSAGTPATAQAVLVSVEKLSSLPRAYPNFFLDMRVFIEIVQDVLKG